MYLEDIIILSLVLKTHLGDVIFILEKLKQSGSFLKLKRCKWVKYSSQYLGRIIKSGTPSIYEATTRSLRYKKNHITILELMFFLGLCSLYCRSVANFAHTEAPRNALLKPACR